MGKSLKVLVPAQIPAVYHFTFRSKFYRDSRLRSSKKATVKLRRAPINNTHHGLLVVALGNECYQMPLLTQDDIFHSFTLIKIRHL